MENFLILKGNKTMIIDEYQSDIGKLFYGSEANEAI